MEQPYHSKVHGEWRDRVRKPDGSWTWVQPSWTSNMIVDRIAPLIAGYFKGEGTFFAAPNIWFEVGSGNAGWDALPDRGKSNETLADVGLVAAVYRTQLIAAQIDYLDTSNIVSVTPTKKVQFTGELGVGVAAVPIREFGLFGGNAAAGLGSGYMIDHVIHPLIDRSIASPLLQRLVRITF